MKQKRILITSLVAAATLCIPFAAFANDVSVGGNDTIYGPSVGGDGIIEYPGDGSVVYPGNDTYPSVGEAISDPIFGEDNSGGGATDLTNITGAETTIYFSAAGTSGSTSDNAYSNVLLSDAFTGLLVVSNGVVGARTTDSDFGGAKAILLDGAGLNFQRESGTFDKDIYIGNGDATIRLYGTNEGVTLTGSIMAFDGSNSTEGTLTHVDGGVLIIDPKKATQEDPFGGSLVYLGGLTQAAGTNYGDVVGSTEIRGAAVIGMATVSAGTLKIATDADETVAINGADVANGNLIVASQGRVEITALVFGNNGKATFSLAEGDDVAEYSVGAVSTVNSANFARDLTVDENVTVNATSLANNWGMGVLTVDGVLDIRGDLKFSTGANNSTASNVITGEGTVRTGKLVLGNLGTYNISVKRLEIGAGGIEFSDAGGNAVPTVNLGATTLAATSSWSAGYDGHALTLTDADAGTTFEMVGENTSANLGAVLEGDGKLVKTGAGMLTLSGDNSFKGGVTVSEGTLVAAHANALGAGALSVEGGAQLSVADGVTLSTTAIGIVLDEAYLTVAALTGTGALAENALVTIDGDLDALGILGENSPRNAGLGDFQIFGADLNAAAVEVVLSDALQAALAEAGLAGTWNAAAGTLTIGAVPEPSAFGLLAGAFALALAVSRRRRK